MALGLVALAVAHGAYGLPAYGAATLAVWWAVVVGLVFGVWPLDGISREAIIPAACLTAFALFAGLSVAWSGDAGHSVEEAVRAAGYAGLFVLVIIASGRGSAPSWLTGLLIGLVAIACLAVASRALPGIFGEPATAEFLKSARSRLSYPVGYWNALGTIMALAITLLAWRSTTSASRLGRAAAASALPVTLLGLFLTSSRGAILGVLAGLAVLMIGARRERLLAGLAPGLLAGIALIVVSLPQNAFLDADRGATAKSQGLIMLAATIVAAIAAGGLRYSLDGPISRVTVAGRIQAGIAIGVAVIVLAGVVASDPVAKFDSFKDASSLKKPPKAGLVKSHLTSGEGTGRYQFWEAAWQAFEHQPVYGVGVGGYEAWWARHGSISYYLRNAHSLPLETMAELGIVGLFLLAGAFGTSVAAGVRRRAQEPACAAAALALVAAGLVCAAIDWTWQFPAALAPVVVGAAVLAGPALGAGRRSPASFPWALGAIAIGWVAIVVTGLVLAGDDSLRASRSATARGDLDEAARAAQRAQKLEPWSSRPRMQMALVSERAGDLKAARGQIEEALDRDGDDWRLWVAAARIRAKTGDLRGARAAVREARKLNPRSPLLSTRG